MRERERERGEGERERERNGARERYSARSPHAPKRLTREIVRRIYIVALITLRYRTCERVGPAMCMRDLAWRKAWPAAVAPCDPTWISLLSGLASNHASLLRDDPEWELASERGVLGARRRAFDPSTEPNRLSEYRARARSCRCHLIGLTSPFGFRTFVRCSSSAVCDTARTQQGRDHLYADNTRKLNKCMYI